MCCTPTERLLIVLTLPLAVVVLSIGYRPLGSCPRTAGWSAATLCFGPSVWTGRALQAENDDLEMIGLALASRPAEFHRRPLIDPSVRLSPHWAPIRRTSRVCRSSNVRTTRDVLEIVVRGRGRPWTCDP